MNPILDCAHAGAASTARTAMMHMLALFMDRLSFLESPGEQLAGREIGRPAPGTGGSGFVPTGYDNGRDGVVSTLLCFPAAAEPRRLDRCTDPPRRCFACAAIRIDRYLAGAGRNDRPGGGSVQGRLSSVWLTDYIRDRGGVLTVERRTVIAG